MNIMVVGGYKANIEYDSELDEFRGEILGLKVNLVVMGKIILKTCDASISAHLRFAYS